MAYHEPVTLGEKIVEHVRQLAHYAPEIVRAFRHTTGEPHSATQSPFVVVTTPNETGQEQGNDVREAALRLDVHVFARPGQDLDKAVHSVWQGIFPDEFTRNMGLSYVDRVEVAERSVRLVGEEDALLVSTIGLVVHYSHRFHDLAEEVT